MEKSDWEGHFLPALLRSLGHVAEEDFLPALLRRWGCLKRSFEGRDIFLPALLRSLGLEE
jgi:hypothetical protein